MLKCVRHPHEGRFRSQTDFESNKVHLVQHPPQVQLASQEAYARPYHRIDYAYFQAFCCGKVYQ